MNDHEPTAFGVFCRALSAFAAVVMAMLVVVGIRTGSWSLAVTSLWLAILSFIGAWKGRELTEGEVRRRLNILRRTQPNR